MSEKDEILHTMKALKPEVARAISRGTPWQESGSGYQAFPAKGNSGSGVHGNDRDMRNYRAHIEDILQAMESIEDFVQGMDLEDFLADDKTASAVVFWDQRWGLVTASSGL